MLNVICVNARDYLGRGDDYVGRLFHAVERNLPGAAQKARFRVLTEKDADHPLEGWWNKLAMFRPGMFEGRCLYFDLDTIIKAEISDIAAYDGPFIALEDFWRKGRLQSSVMAWTAGEMDHVWEAYKAANYPQFDPGGDQNWIEHMAPKARRWQTELPGRFVSLKEHLLQREVFERASVVCFHGLPRPHHLADLMEHWQ